MAMGKEREKKGGEGNGVTSLWHTVRFVLRSSLLSSPLIYFRTPPHGPSSSHFPPTSPIVYSRIPSPGLATGIFSLFIGFLIHSYTLFISSNSFDEISKRSSLLLLRTKLLRLLLLSSLHIMMLNSHPCYHSPSLLNPTRPSFRRRLLRIVFRFFGYCPRAGLFAATTSSHFWNSVATYAWLGLALAVSCAFYAVFASPSQDKLSGLWGGCSFTFHFCFTTFAYEKYLLEGLPRT